MRNTGSSGRSKSTKDKGNSKVAPHNHTSNTVKSEGLPVKPIMATAEQLALNNLIQGKDTSDDEEQKKKIYQIMELTSCTQEEAGIALHDNKSDVNKAVNQILEGTGDDSEWRETGKKKKKQKQEAQPLVIENNIDSKPEKREGRDRNDRDTRDRDRNKDDRENDRSGTFNRESSDNYRRQRRNDNRPPRLSRGRGRPDRAGDRPESSSREDDMTFERDDNRDRGFDRGRGRGRGGFAPRRGGRGGSGGGGAGTFRPPRAGFDKTSQFDNGPQIDTWTNETAVIGEKEPKISKWGDSKEDWNEDIDSWTGSLAETKVFTASANPAPEPPTAVQLDTNTLPDTFDLGALYPKHPQTDIGADPSYITQFNQQATESIKNSIGIGSGPSSSLQNSMTSQTASNVSALLSLTQNALQDNLSSSLNVSELTGNSLTGSGLTGNGLVGTSLGNSLSTSLPVNSLTGNSMHSTSLSGDLSGSSITGTSLSGNSLSGNSMAGNGNGLAGTSVSVSSLTGGLSGTGLAPGSQTASSGVIPTSSVSQNALLQQQQRAKPQRSKLPPPSKIPASAVEMPGHMMATLDVQFGTLEFGTDSTAAFSFGGNESVPKTFSAVDTNSTSTINNHVNAQVGQGSLNKAGEAMMSSGLEQSSPRNSTLYQQSPYTTPTKQNPTDTSNNMNSPPEPLQMPGGTSDLKSTQLISGPSPQVSLPTTKIDSNLGSYTSNSSYQSSGYQSQKGSAGFPSSTKPGSYPGNQYQSSNNQTSSSQFSSQYNRQSGQNQFQSGSNQFPSGSQYQSPPSGYQSNQSGYPSTQTGFQSSQSQFQSGQNQYQNFQTGSTFPSQSSYSSNQSNQNSLYPSSTTSSFTNQTQQNSLYSQNTRQGSYSNQSYMNHDGTSFQTSVTRSSSPFKDSQTGANSFRDSVASGSKTRDSQSDNSTYSRDSNSASSFSDSQSLAYNRDSQSVGSSYSRDPNSAYKRDSKSASGSYPRDGSSSDSATYNRDSQSASASYTGRDSQGSTSGYRDGQTGAAGFGNQAGSYPRDATTSQTQSGFNPKPFRNSTEVATTLQTSMSASKLADGFSKMAVNDTTLDSRSTTNSQFEVSVTNSKLTTNSSALTSSTSPASSSSSTTTVTSSTTTKISTLPTASTSSSKAPPNLPPGVPPLMTQPYIMGQAGTLPFYGLQGLQQLAQQPMYANLEDFQYLQQRMPPTLATSNMYDLSATAAAAGLQMPPTTLAANSNPQTVPTVPYSGSTDGTGKLNRVEAQSPTGSLPTSTPSATGQAAQHQQQQQQPYILNYGYYYPPSLIPGAGFQYPMIPMPQVTNAAHAGTPANTQYQQKTQYGSHLQYGTNKGVYDDPTAVPSATDFSKIPYGNSQTQPKANVNTSVNAGSGSSDIQLPGGYGKTHAQAFDKQGFHAGTPPPFSQLMAAGQLATGTQAGPLGGPGGPYGAPIVPFMTHQPHSQQMMHHPLQDNSSSSRGSQQPSSHSQVKTNTKSYTGSSWGSY